MHLTLNSQPDLGSLPVAEELKAVIAKCLQRSPQDRYPDGSALLVDLEQLAHRSKPLGSAREGQDKLIAGHPATTTTPPRTRAREPWSYDMNDKTKLGRAFESVSVNAVPEVLVKLVPAGTTAPARTTTGHIRISGRSEPTPGHTHATAYFRIATPRWRIETGDRLSYSIWFSPLAPPIGIDLVFDDGSTLRASGVLDQWGRSAHPDSRGGNTPSQWHDVIISLSGRAGAQVDEVLLAYDNGKQPVVYGPFYACLDRIEIGPSPLA